MNKIEIYTNKNKETSIEVQFENETVWLSQAQMADLFGRDRSVIAKHINNCFKEEELVEEVVCANFAHTTQHGAIKGKTQEKNVKYFNLDVVISVGYRVKSKQGTQFRQWATKTLQEYLAKGFVMDDERLRQADSSQYFDELLNRIRDIRSSEKVFWRKVCDIYATSIDYDGKAQSSAHFFAQVQNKMHWAAHGHTASEVVFDRIDADKPGLGLTSYQGKEAGKAPTRKEVIVGKNYLSEAELDT